MSNGRARVRWTASWDKDNTSLTYELYRDGRTTPVYTTTVDSRFWVLPSLQFTDSGLNGGKHTYQIKVTDPLGNIVTGATSSPVTVSGPANTPPTASFTTSCSNLTCSFSGVGSTDADGSVAGYSWKFGDGGTATGVTTAHGYTAAGTYPVTLTVTDNQGASGSSTQQVTVVGPAQPVLLASDSFNRTVASGLGTADVGGPWTSSANVSVSGGAGRLALPAAANTAGGYLGSIARTDTDTAVTASFDKVADGGGVLLQVLGRRVSATAEYRGRLRVLPSGAVTVSLTKLDAGAETFLQTEVTLPGVTYAADRQLRVRLQVTGTSPTTIRMKAWPADAAEPADWQVTATDSAAALQADGSVGLRAYVSGSSTTLPVTASVRALEVRATQ
jgi:PKD repeat protein